MLISFFGPNFGLKLQFETLVLAKDKVNECEAT